MLDKKNDLCKWHRCTIGKRYHHSMEEWNVHAEYAKNDIPTVAEEHGIKQFTYVPTDESHDTGAMPIGYTNTGSQGPTYSTLGKTLGISDKTWRVASIGSMLFVWVAIIWTVAT